MNKIIRPVIFLLFLAMFFSYSFAQEQENPPVTLNAISENLYEIVGGRGANGGLFIGDNGVLIIDAKMDKLSVDQTLREIKKITDKPVKYLVNTHSDGDHNWGNQFFPESVIFVAHENCRSEFFHPKMNNDPSDWNKPELAPFVPSLTFRDKMDIYLGSRKVELWYFGIGHTTGDAVIYFPEEKTAFVGDQLFLTRPQLIHSYKGGNSFDHVKTLTKMLESIEAEKFCSGHSEITDRKQVEAHIGEMKKRQQKIISLVENGKSLEEIKGVFEENEGRLVESIFNEIKNKSL